MPLIKSSRPDAFQSNFKAELDAKKPKAQALAIAYSEKRRALKRAAGGATPWFVRQEASHLGKAPIVGPVRSASPGRADKLNATVHAGSYVLPAQSIAHLGQGNTESGFHVADKMFHTASIPHVPKMRADGGRTKEPEPIDILISGGEFVVHPDKVREIGGGDLEKGHEVLDHFVKMILKNEKKEVSSLPGPAQD